MHYALKNQYPIDTEEQLKTAAVYFGKYINRFDPAQRSAIATNMEKRASDLGVNIDSDWIKNYSRITKESSIYSPDFERNVELRKQACLVGKIKVSVNGTKMSGEKVLEKISEQKNNIKPSDMADLISDFDKLAGLEGLYDNRIYDPIYTVFGSNYDADYDRTKLASGISSTNIRAAACDKEFIDKVAGVFGQDFAKDFQHNPVGIFESMPAPEKELIMEKMAMCGLVHGKKIMKKKSVMEKTA